MHAVLWIFIAAAMGLMLFSTLQENLPDELSFLKTTSVETSPPEADPSLVAKTGITTLEKWTMRRAGDTIELVQRMSGQIEAGGVVYDNPEIGILCHKGRLDVRIDARHATTGTRTTPVEVKPGSSMVWTKGTAKNVFPADPKSLVSTLAKSTGPVKFSFSYIELGNQTVELAPKGLKALLGTLPTTCRV